MCAETEKPLSPLSGIKMNDKAQDKVLTIVLRRVTTPHSYLWP